MMQNIKNVCLICTFVCITWIRFLEAVDVTDRKITASDGTRFNVIEVTDDDADVVILKKDGQMYEQQITQPDKGYVITKVNNTCNVKFDDKKEATNNTCYDGRTPSQDEITEDIKEQCGSSEVRFINAVNCSSENNVHKRWLCFQYCYYVYQCYYVWFYRLQCSLYRICYRLC